MMRVFLPMSFLALLTACDRPAEARGVEHRMACVNAVLGTEAPEPHVVLLSKRDMHEIFGKDGWYDQATNTAYWHADTAVRITVKELARAALAQSGQEQDDERLRLAMRRCS